MATTRSKPKAKPAAPAGGAGGAAGSRTPAAKAKKTKAQAAAAAPAAPVAIATAPAGPKGAEGNAPATMTPTAAPPPEVERRRSPREKHIAPAVVQPASGDASAEAAHGVTVQDLSLGGVGFRSAEKFAAGEVYRITLGKGPLLLNARVRIVSCRQVGHRQYHVGAEYC